jgi:hypothetical protein
VRVSVLFPFRDATDPSGSRPLHFRGFTIALTHITLCRLLWTSDQPGEISVPDNTKQSQETTLHAPGGFEPRIPTSERSHIHALERAATVIR